VTRREDGKRQKNEGQENEHRKLFRSDILVPIFLSCAASSGANQSQIPWRVCHSKSVRRGELSNP
jgi:hypothetical protein